MLSNNSDLTNILEKVHLYKNFFKLLKPRLVADYNKGVVLICYIPPKNFTEAPELFLLLLIDGSTSYPTIGNCPSNVKDYESGI